MPVEAGTTTVTPTVAPIGPTMESSGIARSAKAAAPGSVVSAAGEVAARARRSVAAAAEVATTTTTDVAPTTTRMASASAPVLRQYWRRNDHRPQNSGCQKKAPTLGTHDFHLQLPASPSRGHLNP
jgi:hypothetical protein